MQTAPIAHDPWPAISMEASQRMTVQPSLALLQFAALLPLTSDELDAAIDDEVEENPALERADPVVCPICLGEETRRCLRCCPPPQATAHDHPARAIDVFERSAPPSLADSLLAEARLLLRHEDLAIAELVVGSLDESGFLPGGASELAERSGVDETRMRDVIHALREVGSPAIAANDARECLLLQLDQLESDTAEDSSDPIRRLARAIISDHLEQLARGGLVGLARSLNASAQDVALARRFIRERLSPRPTFGLPGGDQPAPILPDVVVRNHPWRRGELEIEIVDERRFTLKVDPMYEMLASSISPSENRPSLDPDDRARVREAVRRAAFFIDRVGDRARTIRRVAEYVINRQWAFVLGGSRSLRPLTRAEVAEAIGVHESTVSRTVAGKHVMLPSGKIVPFGDFFDASLGVRDMLRELVETEHDPMSDRELTTRLRDLGYSVARRTVAKYRQSLGIAAHAIR